MKLKRITALLLCAGMVFTACGAQGDSGDAPREDETAKEAGAEDTTAGSSAGYNGGNLLGQLAMARRPQFLGALDELASDAAKKPQISMEAVAEDFSNVVYDEEFDHLFEDEDNAELVEGLIRDQFVVDTRRSFDEFYEIYESNRYQYFPSFVTVDSIMHTYHLYFAYLLRNTEKDYIYDALDTLSKSMLNATAEQYMALEGTEWEEAALRNVAFFTVGASLLDTDTVAPIRSAELESMVQTELSRINGAAAIETCTINGLYEDYTQYKPRGYYAGDEILEKYFRAMMWYGRIGFPTEDETAVRCAVLMSSAIEAADLADWEGIYNVSSFFAGASDDPGYYELSYLFDESYGHTPDTEELKEQDEAFAKLSDMMKELALPQINSIPVDDGDDPVICTYRFMGQRFTIDAAIMQKLVYSMIKENAAGERRMLPDTLDVAAALGSDTADELLREQGAFDYEGYSENLKAAKEHFNNADTALWNASLYSGWLYTLRPLLEDKDTEGYPNFMKGEAWKKKELETFAGSYAELKHDTILYAKQIMAEMGDGEREHFPDDRGYVEPEPEIYSRFANLAEKTKDGLAGYGMISASSAEDLDRLCEIAKRLKDISEKELAAESLSDDDYDFIRSYGGDLEHFWYEANKDTINEPLYSSYQAPCPIVADIATDPNGSVLEVGSGRAQNIYVVFPIEGELHVGRGSAYSFYQFVWPMDERLTDTEWRELLVGGHYDDDWIWVPNDEAPAQPEWTQGYRIKSSR